MQHIAIEKVLKRAGKERWRIAKIREWQKVEWSRPERDSHLRTITGGQNGWEQDKRKILTSAAWLNDDGWMDTESLNKKLSTKRSCVIGRLNLAQGREPDKEEELYLADMIWSWSLVLWCLKRCRIFNQGSLPDGGFTWSEDQVRRDKGTRG